LTAGRATAAVNAAIDRRTNDANRQLLIDVLQAEMPAADSNRLNPFSGAAQYSIDHCVTSQP